jgi:hypothetical protein
MVLFKCALLWVQVEVILLQPFENLANQLSMPLDVVFVRLSLLWAHMYCYIVHVAGDVPSVNEVAEYHIHHRLKGCW